MKRFSRKTNIIDMSGFKEFMKSDFNYFLSYFTD